MFAFQLYIACIGCLSLALCSTCANEPKCISFLSQKDCRKNEYLELGPPEFGCCPRCTKGMGLEATGCNDFTIHKKCAPGLKCKNAKCILDKDTCSYTYHLPQTQYSMVPSCEANGSFTAKQCKGDKLFGRCFCYNDNGQRIFGWDWWRNEAANNMTCACSRRRHLLETQQGRIDVTLHCTQNGNYEELQCDSGICWCAMPQTGEVVLGTRAVPAAMWTLLPCYNEDKYGEQYLRQCESAAYAQNLIRQRLLARGMSDVSFIDIKCDYDGSYGAYSIENRIAACIWRDGNRIYPYQATSNQVSTMDCNCARDVALFAKYGLNFPLSCSGNGNYDPVQDINGKLFCVDRDGYAVTGYSASASVIGFDCNQYLYYHSQPDH